MDTLSLGHRPSSDSSASPSSITGISRCCINQVGCSRDDFDHLPLFLGRIRTRRDRNFSGTQSTDSTTQVLSPQAERVEVAFAKSFYAYLDQNKQTIFSEIHPVGTATSVALHDVSVAGWRNGVDTNRQEDAIQTSARFTLYWSGPITTNGYTKMELVWDIESKRMTGGRILAPMD